MISDVELNRAINALSTTLRDQRPAAFDAPRLQSIVDGSLGGERKLVVRHVAGDRGRLTGASASEGPGAGTADADELSTDTAARDRARNARRRCGHRRDDGRAGAAGRGAVLRRRQCAAGADGSVGAGVGDPKVARRISGGVFQRPVPPERTALLTHAMRRGYGSGCGSVSGIVQGSVCGTAVAGAHGVLQRSSR